MTGAIVRNSRAEAGQVTRVFPPPLGVKLSRPLTDDFISIIETYILFFPRQMKRDICNQPSYRPRLQEYTISAVFISTAARPRLFRRSGMFLRMTRHYLELSI